MICVYTQVSSFIFSSDCASGSKKASLGYATNLVANEGITVWQLVSRLVVQEAKKAEIIMNKSFLELYAEPYKSS